MTEVAFYAPLAGLVLGLLFLWGSLRVRRRCRLLDDLPTAKVQGVFIGLVELKGTAEAEAPLTAFLSRQRCVYYRYRVDEHWSRTVTGTTTDSKGQTQTTTRHESGWTTVAESGEMTDFYLRDDTGAVLVRPAGARIEPAGFFDETCGRDEPLYYSKGPQEAVPNSDHRRRFVEGGVALHAVLYVVGQARERPDVVAPELAADHEAPVFLISTRTEEKVRAGLGRLAWALLLAGAVVVLGGVAIHLHGAAHRPWTDGLGQYAGLAGAYAAMAVLGWITMAYNSLVSLRERVRTAWSLVDVQLQRRHDLIPRLVDAVSALRDHERGSQTALAALRGQLAATAPGVSGPDFAGCAPAVRALAEAYPDLKSDAAFLALQRQLIETEQRIALARTYFNDIATFYNTRLAVVPDRLIAAGGLLRPQSLLAAGEFERAPVDVRLAD